MNSKLLMTSAEVQAACTISRTTVYRLVKSGRFPRPVKVGERAIRWRTADVQGWLDTREPAGVAA